MNRILIQDPDLLEKKLVNIPCGPILSHIHEVLRAKTGDTLKICIPGKGIGTARINKLNDESCDLLLLKLVPGLEPRVRLIIGASRPPTVRKILEHGTCLGVHSFDFLNSELSEKSYLQSKVFRSNETRKHIDLGLSQSAVYYRRPEVCLSQSFHDLDKILSKTPQNASRILLDQNADHHLGDLSLDMETPIVLAIGPERGFSSREIQVFKEKSFQSAKISPATLRVEWAVMAALSQLDFIWMEKGN